MSLLVALAHQAPDYVRDVLTSLQAPPATPDPNPLSQGLAVGLMVLYAIAVIWGLEWIFRKPKKEEEEHDDDFV